LGGEALGDEAEGGELAPAFVALPAALEALPGRILDGEEGVAVGRDGAAGGEAADHLAVESRQPHGLDAVVDERLPDEREERPNDLLADRRGVLADLELGVGIHPQREKVEEIVEIDLPVGLGVGRKGKILAGLFAGDARLEPLLVNAPGEALELRLQLREAMAGSGGEAAVRALPIGARLGAPLAVVRRLHRIDGKRVARGIFVDVGRAVAHPLPPAVHRDADDELQLRHLERRRVGMPEEIADQLAVVAHLPRAVAVADASRLNDCCVVPHHVDEGDMAVVEHRELLPAE